MFQFSIKLRVIAAHAMSHACNNLIVVRYDVSQCFNIFYRDNSSHPLRHIPCKLDLMIIHMLIELMLTRHNDGRFSNL